MPPSLRSARAPYGQAAMIHFMLMVNKHGQTRLADYYTRCVPAAHGQPSLAF